MAHETDDPTTERVNVAAPAAIPRGRNRRPPLPPAAVTVPVECGPIDLPDGSRVVVVFVHPDRAKAVRYAADGRLLRSSGL